MNIQSENLTDGTIQLIPLREQDFDALFSVASDPLIWEQHPNSNRYLKEEFLKFFQGAIESKGAFKIIDCKTQEPLGSSRYYDVDMQEKSVFIGYTFLRRDKWGGNYNARLKALMINHAFQFVNKTYFQIATTNMRSLRGTEKIGATIVGTQILEGIEHFVLEMQKEN